MGRAPQRPGTQTLFFRSRGDARSNTYVSRLNYTETRDSCQRAKFSGQRAKFSVIGVRKKYFLMNFRFRKVFAPLSAVREKSANRVSSRTLAMVCTPMKMFLFSKNRPRSLVLLPPLVARTKLPQKKLFPLHFCSNILHDCFHPSLTHPSPLAFCAP